MDKSNAKFVKIKYHDWQKLFLELVVVFLGVTAGFLLNNWQNQKQTSSLEKKYLNGFLQDANANISELTNAVKADSLWLHNVKPKLLDLRKGKLKPDSANGLFKMIVNISKADIKTGTYDAIVNSGNMNIISNYMIKKQIVDYSSSISGTRYIEDYFYQYFNEFVMPFVFSNYNILKGALDNPGIIKTTKFSNVVTGYYSMVQQRLVSYKKLLDDSLKLRDNLNKTDNSNGGVANIRDK